MALYPPFLKKKYCGLLPKRRRLRSPSIRENLQYKCLIGEWLIPPPLKQISKNSSVLVSLTLPLLLFSPSEVRRFSTGGEVFTKEVVPSGNLFTFVTSRPCDLSVKPDHPQSCKKGERFKKHFWIFGRRNFLVIARVGTGLPENRRGFTSPLA